MAAKRAFVTGVGGQDGYYLSRLLLEKGYEVVGCGRPSSLLGRRGDELRDLGVRLVDVDLLHRETTQRAIAELAPDPALWAGRERTWPTEQHSW